MGIYTHGLDIELGLSMCGLGNILFYLFFESISLYASIFLEQCVCLLTYIFSLSFIKQLLLRIFLLEKFFFVHKYRVK